MADNYTELEVEITELKSNIAAVEKAAAVKRDAAERLHAEMKASGLDPYKGVADDDKDAFERLDSAYKAADADFETGAELRRRLDAAVNSAANSAIEKARGDLEHPAIERASVLVSDRFLASDAYRQLRRSGALDMSQARVNTAPVLVADRKTAMAMLYRAAMPGVADLVPVDQSLMPPVEAPVRALRMRDLVTVTETDTDTVEFVRETTRTDAAAETAYGDADVANSGVAPRAQYVYTAASTSVKRIPHWVPATKGNLADQGQLRGLLDSRLVYGVGKRVDTQILNGGGTGEDLKGILAETIGSQALGTDTPADAYHKGMTLVRVALEDEPTGFAVNPSDFEEFALQKGADGHYLSGQGPHVAGPRTIWGLPAVVTTAVTAGTALVGDFKRGATLWVRSGISVAASDSHEDFFLRGLVALLAETRVAFAVLEPKAFCKVTGI